MLALIHVTIAVASLILTGFTYFLPSRLKLNFSYGLIAGTIISGTALVITKPAHILSACISGLIYLAVALTGIILASRRLAKETQKIN